MLSFCLRRGGSRCKDVFLKVFLLDKTFKILAEGPTLENPVSFAVMDGAVVFRSGMNRSVCLHFQRFNLGLALDGFEDVLDRKLRQSEVVVHSVSSEWILLVV